MPRPSAAARSPQLLKIGARGGRIVKGISLRSALLPAMLAIAFSGACRADEVRAKIQYCTECHGASGRGYHGFYPIPRLAGQPKEYIQNQLRAFVEHTRTPRVAMDMAKVHGVSPELRAALSQHFRDLNPSPIRDAPRGSVSMGQKIYEEGIPGANIPACAACHGPEGKGGGQIPSLAGQLYPYVQKTLANWSEERSHTDATAIMKTIAGNMTKTQIEAIAAYVNHLN